MSLLRALDGRVLGPQGAGTRAAILAAVAKHLASTPWHRASVAAVTLLSGTSTATFYQYFPDLAAAVRELAVGVEAPEHLRLIVGLLDWEDAHCGAVGADA